MGKVSWSLIARRHLREIYDYIAHDDPEAAARFVDRLRSSTERLAEFPNSGRPRPGDATGRAREVIVGNYRLAYVVTARGVTIVGVAHGARDIP